MEGHDSRQVKPSGFLGDLNRDGDIDISDFALLQARPGESLPDAGTARVNADLNAARLSDRLDVSLP
ncbi:MAG: hypothetical protein KA354_13645 [Phycisphaerae bacterium]|nr:hypothetical protein [Phycisphaerae bacterium]